MGRAIIIYGLVMALLATALAWLNSRFWIRDTSFELYGAAIALIFAGLGVWIGLQHRNVPPNTGPNQKAIDALGLTLREQEILIHLRAGQSNKELARTMGVSPNTVKTHLANLYEKLGVKNRTQAVTTASELSLLPPKG